MNYWSIMGMNNYHSSFEIDGDSRQFVDRCMGCMIPFDRKKYLIIPPVKIKIVDGNLPLGDFSYCSGRPYPIVRERVKHYFEKRNFPCKFLPVEILKTSKKVAGENLFLLRCYKSVPIDENLSTLRYRDCPECKRRKLYFPRPDEGDTAIVSSHGEKLSIFVWDQFFAETTFMTEEVLEELRAQGFTNLEDLFFGGEIVE